MKKKTMFVPLLAIIALASCSGEGESSSISWSDDKPTYYGELWQGSLNLTGLDAAKKTELLGKMEKYAQENHLTGIPLYGSGGYTLLSERVAIPTGEYLTNYGFGTLREGYIKTPMTAEQESNEAYRSYYHSNISSATNKLSQFDADDTGTSTLVGYISSSLFSTRLKKKGDNDKTYEKAYEWYGSLADQDAPTPVDADYATTGSSKKWKFKVKTGANSGLKYKTASEKSIDGTALSTFNDREVKIEDYIFALKVLATYSYGNAYWYQYAEDTSSIVGVSDYINATVKDGLTSADAKKVWEGVGYKAVDDETIEVEFEYPTDSFGATYRLSDMLLCPVPEDYYALVTTLKKDGAIDSDDFDPERYGKTVSDKDGKVIYTPADTRLCLGAYTITKYDAGTGTDGQLVFVRNDDWVEIKDEKESTGYDIYKIPGVVVNIKSALKTDPMANYNDFKAGKVDASSIPASAAASETGDKPYKYWTEGSSVWKLQVNALNQAEWNNIFKKGGEVASDYQTENEADYYACKPIMSNDNFINGIYTSINREELATLVGADVGDSFFSDAYEIDPINHVSYNSTDAHKNALASYYPSTHGYNLEAAKRLFSAAIDEEVAAGHYKAGTAESPTVITIQAAYQTESQFAEEGNAVKKYIEDAFNAVGPAKGFKLEVENYAPATWSDIYYNMTLVGKFDLAFASISGSTLDPLNFMNTLCSNSRSTFTLSWGAHTNWCTGDIIYEGKALSYDALYQALVLGDAVIKDGELVY